MVLERHVDPEARPYVKFNHLKNPINDVGEECKSTIRKLVKTTVPISYMDWRKVPQSKKVLILEEHSSFYFPYEYGEYRSIFYQYYKS